jgi:hypothetical protein
VTTERRLAAVEAALTPTELVVRWLDEAHAHGGIDAFVRSALADAAFVPPINQLARMAADGARASLKGKPREEINKAADQAVRETLFRFHLVMRINVITHDLLERELLLTALFSARLSLLITEPRAKRQKDPTYLERLTGLRDLISGSLAELKAAGQAREQVEQRYLGGHVALFPDDAVRWVEQLKTSEIVERLSIGLAEKDDARERTPLDPHAVADRVAGYAADLVEPAKVAALEDLDDGYRALGIATSWLRGKLGEPIDAERAPVT